MMEPENIGEKFFCFVARARLRTLRIFRLADDDGLDIDEYHLMLLLAIESNWVPERVCRAHCFHDAASVAIYEMRTRKPGWEWIGACKSCALVLFNETLYKQQGQYSIEAAIIRTGENEWRVYREGEKNDP
jgi:hypothetical protein